MSDDELDRVPDMPITRRWLSQEEWRSMPAPTIKATSEPRPARKYGPKPNESQLAEMLTMMDREGGETKAAMAARLKLTVKAIEYRLDKLKASGLCRASGMGTNVRWLRMGAKP